jgi:hypothetical protein
MKRKQGVGQQEHRENTASTSHRIRLPGFLVEEETGLGDVVKRMTYAMGIKPCGGCENRAAALNRWVRFTR